MFIVSSGSKDNRLVNIVSLYIIANISVKLDYHYICGYYCSGLCISKRSPASERSRVTRAGGQGEELTNAGHHRDKYYGPDDHGCHEADQNDHEQGDPY